MCPHFWAAFSLVAIAQVVAAQDKDFCQEEVSVDLLQRKITTQSDLHSGPVYWLHIAKCNSGFQRSILLLPGLCSDTLKDVKAILSDPAGLECASGALYASNPGGARPEDFCQGGVADLRNFGMEFGDHSALGLHYETYVRNHGMTILRQPEQRLISAWNDGQHSWPRVEYGRFAHNISEYAAVVGGCATKMMTRSQVSGAMEYGDSACGDPDPPTAQEIALAISRLKEGFIFVGIIEEYDLSVCLFHKMFGGQCTGLETEKAHSADDDEESSDWYDTTVLNGWVDEADRALYAAGRQMFQDNLKLYGVSEQTCQACWDQAAAWTPKQSGVDFSFCSGLDGKYSKEVGRILATASIAKV